MQLNGLIRSIETIAKVSVLTLKGHEFRVTVTNFPKSQVVKGTVTVGNQKNLEKELKEIKKILKSIEKGLSAK